MEYPKDLRREFPGVYDRAYEQMKKFRLVKDIMTPRVVTITEDKTMADAARIMGEKHIGSLVVEVDAKPKGIVTERDLLSGILALEEGPGEVEGRRSHVVAPRSPSHPTPPSRRQRRS